MNPILGSDCHLSGNRRCHGSQQKVRTRRRHLPYKRRNAVSTFAHYFKRPDLAAFQSLWLLLYLFFTLCSPARGDETKLNPELLERKVFIELATKETWERVSEEVEEMSKRGIHPSMSVTILQPFGDWDFYFVMGGSINWSPNKGQHFQPVNVPVGFVTDLTSIPRVFWQVLRPEGRYTYAAVVHDYLYWEQVRSRKEADRILKIAMEDSKVDPKLINTVYLAVRAFGQAAWDNNARLKRAGEHRMLKRFPQDFTVSWSEWKKQPGVFAEE